jgi:hypothetical protein
MVEVGVVVALAVVGRELVLVKLLKKHTTPRGLNRVEVGSAVHVVLPRRRSYVHRCVVTEASCRKHVFRGREGGR